MEKWELAEFSGKSRVNLLREYLTAFFKHKGKVAAILLATIGIVGAVLATMKPEYESRSTIMVKMGREYLTRTDVGDSKSVMAVSQEELVNSEIQIVTNRELIEKVIGRMSIDAIYPDLVRKPPKNMSPMAAAVARFEKKLSVLAIRKSNVMQVTFRHRNPEVAARAVNLLVDAAREKHLQVFSEPQSGFLQQQLENFSRKLKDSEQSLESFKQKNGVYALEEQRSLLLKQRMELDSVLKSSQNSINELRRKIATIKGQMKTVANTEPVYAPSDGDRIISDTKAKLLALQLSEQDLLKKYTENNRLVVNARKEIELVKSFLATQEREASLRARSADPIRQDLTRDLLKAEADLEVAQSKNASVMKQLASVDGQIRSLDLTEQGLGSLKREKELNERNYRAYMDRAEEARRTEEMNLLKLANISVIQAASVPAEPAKSKRMLILLAGIAAGCLAALVTVVLAEAVQRKFSTPEKIEQLMGLPVLMSIPYRES